MRGRASGAVAAAVVLLTQALALDGCLRRSDFVPPPAPEPLVPAREPVAPSGPLTPAETVRLVLAYNPDLHAAEARVAEARARLAAAEAAFYPRLGGDLTFLRADAPSLFLFKRIDAHALPPGTDFNDPGDFSNAEAGLTLRWNVLNGGRDQLGRWAADAGVAGSLLARDATANALVATALAALIDARAARELVAADDASVRTVEAQVEESRVLVEHGAALRSDLLSLEVRLAEVRQQRVRTDVAQKLALAGLRDLLALPVAAPLEVTDAAWDAGPLPDTMPDGLAEAYRRRPETQAARRGVERARLQLESARRAYLPRLDLETRLYADDAEVRADPGDPNWVVAVALSVDLFDGGARAAGVAQARAALDELAENDRRLLHAVAREVETAYLRLDEARARQVVAVQAVGAADETLDLVAAQYRGGAATVTRFLEAESARARARTARIQSDLDVSRATVALARAIGRLVPDEGSR